MASLATAVNSPRGAKVNKSERVTADATFDPNCGFICNLAGLLSYRLRADETLRTMIVQAGEFYPFDIAEFDIDGSVASQIVTVFFRVS